MSIIFADSFDIYGTDATFMLDGVYAQVDSIGGLGSQTNIKADPDGLSTQKCLYIGTGDRVVRKVLPALQDVTGIAIRLWLAAIPANTDQGPTFQIRSASNVTLATVEVTPSGRIKYTGGIVAETVNPVITAEGWWHLEMKFDATNDNFELRVEGVTKLDVADLVLAGAHGQVALTNRDSSGGFGVGVYVKDFVIWNGQGTQNNAFIGAVRVINLEPNADVTLGDWVPSTGTEAYPILDNNPPSDTVYLAAPIGGAAHMQVELENLPPDISSIRAVCSVVRAAKADGGDGQMQVSVESGVVVGNGADRPITAAQIYWMDIFEVDPATAAPWSPGAVDLAELRVDRTV